MLPGPTKRKIVLKGQIIPITEDIIEIIKKDLFHVWGWYKTETAQAWTEISPAIPALGSLNPPLLTDMVWIQEISPFWNFQADIPRINGVHCPVRIRSQPSPKLRFTQYPKEVYCATLPELKERKVILSAPIKFYWQGNRASLKMAQVAKCIPCFAIMIRCSEKISEGYLLYNFSIEATMNNLWEMWLEKA
jgi:hypothetical protein